MLVRRLAREVAATDKRFETENPFQLPTWRTVALAIATLFYGSFSLLLIINIARALAG